MDRGFNVDLLLASVGWTGATMAGSHVLWPRAVVRTAINGLRVLAAEQDAELGLDLLRQEMRQELEQMHRLPLLLLAFRDASIAEMGLKAVPDRWLECLDMAFGVAIAEAPIADEAEICALIAGIARQPDRRLWWHLDSLLDVVAGWVEKAGWSVEMRGVLVDLRTHVWRQLHA